jgi:PPIC-type PPIASE domain
VPKALALLALAAAVAIGAGLALPASAIKVGSTTLSAATFGDELAAIKSSPMFECYLQARVYVSSQDQSQGPTLGGASPQSNSSLAADLWADERVTQLAVAPFVASHDPGAFAPAALRVARDALATTIVGTLDGAFSAQSSSTGFSCPAVVTGGATPHLVSGAVILASLPAWFQSSEVRAEAADLGLIDLLPNKLPESGVALEQWYAAHQSQFETTCVRDIEVLSSTTARTVESKIAAGLTFAAAAEQYSKDTSTNKKGGLIGCFSPSSPAWAQVEHYVGATATHRLALWPVNGAYYLFSPTKRTPNRFAQVEAAVETQVHNANVQSSAILGASIQDATPVSIGSWLGTWQLSSIGGQVVPSASPPSAAVTNPTANTPTG